MLIHWIYLKLSQMKKGFCFQKIKCGIKISCISHSENCILTARWFISTKRHFFMHSSWHLLKICKQWATDSQFSFHLISSSVFYPRIMMVGWLHSCPAPSRLLCRLVWDQGRSILLTWWRSEIRAAVSRSLLLLWQVCITDDLQMTALPINLQSTN